MESFSPFQVSALFEVAVLEHFLRPPINYETAENPYACNDVPPTEHGVVSYFLIRKTNVHPRVIALYRSSDPFTTACTEANLKSIVSFFPEANTQQVVVPPPGGFITHWKALSTISPEWNLYTEYMTQPGQKLMRSSMPPYEWLDIHSAVSVQDYEYDWEDIANRRRGYWGANDLYPPSPHSSDDEDDDDESSDWEDSGYQTSDANDFEFETESIENCSGDAAWAGRRGGEDKRNIPLARVDQVRPRGVLLSQGFFIDPEKEDAELGRDRDARELEEEVGDSFGQIQEIDMNRGDSELSGRLRSVQESPMTVFEEEGNPEREYPVQAGVQPPGGIPQINNNHQPPVQDISPFLGYQPGGYTGDVDKFFDFR